MIDIQQIYDYCSKKKGVTESFPFDNDTLVLKVLGKMFLLTSLKDWETGTPFLNLKNDPDESEYLRANYESITPGFHMNKTHWNSVALYKGDLTLELILKLIDTSYNLVFESLPKKQRDTLK